MKRARNAYETLGNAYETHETRAFRAFFILRKRTVNSRYAGFTHEKRIIYAIWGGGQILKAAPPSKLRFFA